MKKLTKNELKNISGGNFRFPYANGNSPKDGTSAKNFYMEKKL